jgi:ubiquitin carboxyl-terminal hydrolase 9/24
MEPYTVQGLAKAEGNYSPSDDYITSFNLGMSVIDESAGDDSKVDAHYKLVGIIVHSGQANGGHYYSFIQNK